METAGQDLDVEDQREAVCSLENSTIKILSPNPAIKPSCQTLRTLNHLLSFYLSLFPSPLARAGLWETCLWLEQGGSAGSPASLVTFDRAGKAAKGLHLIEPELSACPAKGETFCWTRLLSNRGTEVILQE